MYRAFAAPEPDYLHLPVVVTRPGMKLSKQNHAPALVNSQASANLELALSLLGQALPAELSGASCTDILQWAIANWRVECLPTADEVSLAKDDVKTGN